MDPDVTAERGTFSARRGKDVPQDGGWLPKKPGIVFPVHALDGEISTASARTSRGGARSTSSRRTTPTASTSTRDSTGE